MKVDMCRLKRLDSVSVDYRGSEVWIIPFSNSCSAKAICREKCIFNDDESITERTKITYPLRCRITRQTSYCDKLRIGMNQKLDSIRELEETTY